MIALLAAAAAAAQAPEQTAEEPAKPRLPYSIEFARTQIGPWQIEAGSIVQDETGLPMRQTAYCEIRRGAVTLRTWREGQLSVYLGGNFLKGDQEDLDIDSETIRRIELDDSAWEYRWLGRWPENHQFADLRYPPPPPKYPPGWDIIHHPIMDALSGWIAVRRRPGSPWFSADVIGNEMVRARRLRIGFVDRDRDPEPDDGPLLWAEMSLDRLGDAFAWCRGAMAGEPARRFQVDLDP